MKNSGKVFILIEVILAVMVLLLAMVMLGEKGEKNQNKISVLVQESDDSQWKAFKYGLKMAAEDQGVEVVVVSTGKMTSDEQITAIEQEIDNGADAVIVQPVSAEQMEKRLQRIEKKIPIMLVECSAGEAGETSKLPVTEADNHAIGAALADELLADCGKNLNGKTLQIHALKKESEAVKSREKGLKERLEELGCEVFWKESETIFTRETDSASAEEKVDFVIALDDGSLVQAGEYAAAGMLRGALVYGVGRSTEAVYCLDTGKVECLVVPEEFSMGYESLTETAKIFQRASYGLRSNTVSYTVIRKETLFSKENQEILFTMSQ